MRSFPTFIIAFCIAAFFPAMTFAALSHSTEVSCSNYGASANSCQQCFDAGTDYVGDGIGKAFDDTFINKTSDDYLIKRSNGLLAGPVSLQSSVQVVQTSDYKVVYDPSFTWIKQGTADVSIFFAGQSVPFALMHGGLGFSSVTAGANPNIPALRFEYIVTTQPYDFVTKKVFGVESAHKECAFVAPRWCGDGILETPRGEQCDLGDQNGQPGSPCSATCTPAPVIPTPFYACVAGNPSADCSTNSYATQAACLLANPGASGRVCYASADIASCNANRAVQCPTPPPTPYYSCIPGNPSADCTTNGYPTQAACLAANPGASGRVCYTSANIASCNANRTTQCPVPPPVGGPPPGGGGPSCVTGNPAVFNGSAIAFPITASTTGLCPARESVGNFTVQMNGNTSRYSWSCNSLAGINCTAFYTPEGGGTPPPGGGIVTVPGSESIC